MPSCWVSVTIESEATTDSDDFDPIFLNLSPLFRNIVGCSTFVEDSLECPRMLLRISTLLHEKSSICHVLSNLPSHLTPSTRRWVFFFHNFLNHLISGVRIKRSCLCSYGELVSKEFSFQFSRKCMTPSKRDRVFSACRWTSAVRRSQNLFKSNSSFGQRIIFFNEAKIPFRERIISVGETQNSFRGKNSKLL